MGMTVSPLALVDQAPLIDDALLEALGARGFDARAVPDGAAAREAALSKIVPHLDAAICRVYEVALPLEEERVRQEGGAGSAVNKLVVYEREPVPGRTTLILVQAVLGF